MNIFRRIFKPQKTMPTKTARIIEICQQHNAVLAEENAYFSAADAAVEDSRKTAQIRADQLATKLRDSIPTAEDFAALAETRQLLANMRELSGQAPFWNRGQSAIRRACLHPEAKATATEIVSLARDFIAPRLAEARKADEKHTRDLDAREPIVSGATRKLESVLKSADLCQEWLAEDSDNGRFWQPFSGLCALLEGMTHE